MSPLRLVDLPNEILFLIAWNLPRLADIATLFRVNRNLHDRLVNELYFNAIRIDYAWALQQMARPCWHLLPQRRPLFARGFLKAGIAVYNKDDPALFHIVGHANHFVCDLILHDGAEVNAVNPQGETPLLMAIAGCCINPHDYLLVAMVLLNYGADPNHLTSDDDRATSPLRLAFHSQCFLAIELLLKYGANPNLPARSSQKTRTPLHWAVMSEWGSRYWIIKTLIDAGADPTFEDPEGWTPGRKYCGRALAGWYLYEDDTGRLLGEVLSAHQQLLAVAAYFDRKVGAQKPAWP